MPTPIRHLVIFHIRPGATPEQVKSFTDHFRALKDNIPGIIAFEHGENNSPEGMNRGLNHVYMLTFQDAAARDAYLPHQEHKKFIELNATMGITDEVFVIDYAPEP